MLSSNNTVLVLIDVQGRLAQIMHEKEALFTGLTRLVQGIRALKVPIIWTEQIPEKMGPTIPELAGLLAPEQPISKASFSCMGENVFVDRLQQSGRKEILLAGIETHVCVYQTAADLVAAGYHVEVVADCVSSRSPANKLIGLEKIKACGGRTTSMEIVLFELMKTARHPAFRDILKVVR